MKSSNYCILALSLYSYVFTMVAGISILSNKAIIDRVGILLLITAAVQVIIAIIAVVTGRDKNGKE